MDLDAARIGALFAPVNSLWSGSVQSYTASTFTLAVANAVGSLSDVTSGLAAHRNSLNGDRVRIKGVNAGSDTITLAENGADWTAGDSVIVPNIRMPWTRYQRIDSGTVYKDYDVSWTSNNASLKPMALCSPQAIWSNINTDTTVDASDSVAVAPGASISSYAWDAGTDGTVTGSGSSVDVKWSSTGFRYLKLTVTDDNSIASLRYIPVWVGSEAWNVTSARLRWRVGRGWTGSISLESTIAPEIARLPVALFDMDSPFDLLFFGFTTDIGSTYDFEKARHEVQVESVLSYARQMHSYPFILLNEDSPDQWREVTDLTLGRAMAFLLHWHSTIPQVANCNVYTPSSREIQGQEFRGGSIAAQLDEIAKGAFIALRGYRGGGFTAVDDPLYASSATFGGLSVTDLTSASNARKSSSIRWASPRVSEVRLEGVYRDMASGSWEPVITRAPEHPGALGSPSDVTGLAPISEAEMLRWAQRHYAIENNADAYSVTSAVDVDPSINTVAQFPNEETVAVESAALSHDAGALSWELTIDGRTRGDDPSSQSVTPPTVTESDPPDPGDDPPVTPIIDPDPEWPSEVYVVFKTNGMYTSSNFTGPDDSGTTWTQKISGFPTPLADNPIYQVTHRTSSGTLYIYAIVKDTAIYVWDDSGETWSSLYAAGDADTLTGQSGGEFHWLAIDPLDEDKFYVLFGTEGGTDVPNMLVSNDAGSNWSSYEAYSRVMRAGGVVQVSGSYIYATLNMSALANSRVIYSSDSGQSFSRSDMLSPAFGTNWTPPAYLKPGTADELITMYRDVSGNYDPYRFLSQSSLQEISTLADAGTVLSEGYPKLVMNSSAPQLAAFIDGGSLHWTDDDWATKTTISQAVTPGQIHAAQVLRPNWLISTRATAGSSPSDENMLWVSENYNSSMTAKSTGLPFASGVALDGVVVVAP